jgi:hypothetical protein
MLGSVVSPSSLDYSKKGTKNPSKLRPGGVSSSKNVTVVGSERNTKDLNGSQYTEPNASTVTFNPVGANPPAHKNEYPGSSKGGETPNASNGPDSKLDSGKKQANRPNGKLNFHLSKKSQKNTPGKNKEAYRVFYQRGIKNIEKIMDRHLQIMMKLAWKLLRRKEGLRQFDRRFGAKFLAKKKLAFGWIWDLALNRRNQEREAMLIREFHEKQRQARLEDKLMNQELESGEEQLNLYNQSPAPTRESEKDHMISVPSDRSNGIATKNIRGSTKNRRNSDPRKNNINLYSSANTNNPESNAPVTPQNQPSNIFHTNSQIEANTGSNHHNSNHQRSESNNKNPDSANRPKSKRNSLGAKAPLPADADCNFTT